MQKKLNRQPARLHLGQYGVDKERHVVIEDLNDVGGLTAKLDLTQADLVMSRGLLLDEARRRFRIRPQGIGAQRVEHVFGRLGVEKRCDRLRDRITTQRCRNMICDAAWKRRLLLLHGRLRVS